MTKREKLAKARRRTGDMAARERDVGAMAMKGRDKKYERDG